MNNAKDAIRILARRFVSLSPQVRVQVAAKLLRSGEDDQVSKEIANQKSSLQGARKKSFMELFWDEVEAAHNDGLYRLNPFSEKETRPVLYGVNPEQLMAQV